MRNVLIASILILAACDSGAVGEGATASRSHLAVTYVPVCGEDNTLWLEATVRNLTNHQIRIPNGVLPWHYDGMGTRFEVIGNKGKIPPRAHYATAQQIGPELLRPKESRSGRLPLEFLFPGAELASKDEPLVFSWVYWTDRNKSKQGNTLTGSTRFASNPCRNRVPSRE